MENKQDTQTEINMASKAYTTFPICQCKGNASIGVYDSSKLYTAMLWLMKQETVTFEFEDHTEEAYQNIESQRKETETMNKSHMLYQSGSQSEESGQAVLGFVAIAIGAATVAYGVYKIAEPLTTMLQNIP